VQWREATADDEVVEAVRLALAAEGELSTCVLTLTTRHRELLIRYLKLVRFGKQENEGDVVCETVRRLKGLDVDRLVLVVDDQVPASLDELYTSISRANDELVVISSREVGEVLGLADPS
jgi:hypothetical protein